MVETSSTSKAETDHAAHKGGFLCWRIWLAYALLGIIGIPWYWPPDHDTTMLGLPTWSCVSLLSSFAASILTTWLLLTHWPESPEDTADSTSDHL